MAHHTLFKGAILMAHNTLFKGAILMAHNRYGCRFSRFDIAVPGTPAYCFPSDYTENVGKGNSRLLRV
jgi:hypothetical protein